MRFPAYLRDHVLGIILWCGASLASAYFLSGLDVGSDAVWYVEILFGAAFWVALIADYFQRRAWFAGLLRELEGLDKKHKLSVVVEPGGFAESQIFAGVLEEVSLDMHDEIASHAKARSEYREYLERWIHEIKTPIAAAGLIAQNDPSGSMRKVEYELRRIEAYVMQALYYARSSAVEKDYTVEKTTLGRLVDSALRRNARELISASFSIDKGDLDETVYTDPKWIGFVLDQIVQNAVKYRKDSRGTLHFASRQGDSFAELIIEDEGIGVPEGELRRLFDKGFTGTAGRMFGQSTGMGLYICRQLLEKMHHGIRAEGGSKGGLSIVIRFARSRMHDFAD